MMTIDELLIDFDEMGFVPTTLCENPDEYARDWKRQLLVEIKRLKAEFNQLETNAEILARGVRDLNHENYELTEKIKQAQIEEIAKFDKLCYDYNKLLYIIRCNMTSITRYIRNENETYDIRYKELAEKAVENILTTINCEVEE